MGKVPVGRAAAVDGTVVEATVVEWDDRRGWGVARTAAGDVLPFHCTTLTDGSRTTTVGTSVRVVRGPGHHGRWEAVRVEPLRLAADPRLDAT